MSSEPLTAEQIEHFHRDGYLIVESMFDAEEMDLLKRAAKEDRELEAHSYSKGDGEGGKVRMSLWNHPGDGIYGMFARCRRIVDGSEQLLGEELRALQARAVRPGAIGVDVRFAQPIREAGAERVLGPAHARETPAPRREHIAHPLV